MAVERITLQDLLGAIGGPTTPPSPKLVALANAVRFIRTGSDVKRHHTQSRVVEEKVGQHSFHVAWFAFFLSDRKPSRNLLMACLSHDLPEGRFGDIPGDYKSELGSIFSDEIHAAEDAALKAHDLLFELTDEEKLILKLSDNMDGLCSYAEEHFMGNCRIHVPLDNYKERVEKIIMSMPSSRTKEIAIDLFEMIGGNHGGGH